MSRKRLRFDAVIAGVLALSLALVAMAGCAQQAPEESTTASAENATKTITDMRGRSVEIPADVKSIACVSITLRQVSYLGAQDLVIGVEEGEHKDNLGCPYKHVNYERFLDLPVIGEGGNAINEEAVVALSPDVIIADEFDAEAATALQERTGIPVVACDIPELIFDQKYYDNLTMLGEVLNKQDRAAEIIAYIKDIQADLASRAFSGADAPTGYAGAITWSGGHGFEGTEANFTPFDASGVVNISDGQGSDGCFDIDLEKVLTADPDYIFLEIGNLDLVLEQAKENPDYYASLKAVKNGNVYSVNSVRSYSTNVELMLANCYQVGIMVNPEAFADVDPNKKLDEITTFFLGQPFSSELAAEGREFRQIDILGEAANFTPQA